MQGYLAVGEAVDGFISDAALEWADDRKLRFVGQNSSTLSRRPTSP
jgi:hypothetical protein